MMSSDEREKTVSPRQALNGFVPAALESARDNAGMTRGTLARKIGVDPTTIHGWETGRSHPTPDLLARAAEELGILVDALVDIDPDQRTLTDLRVLAGLTQRQLADRIGLSQPTVGRIERGEARLTDPAAELLASTLGLPLPIVRDAHRRARDAD
ncbi:helix-turn-helix domain-containing protein [Antrihabitans spumae]|uniref:Helix-turn-helix domain-containing protein n=1 Tax=Antrihabitans spumae TaxID=3373370 RepID=A0ABW7JIV6_9NOCA